MKRNKRILFPIDPPKGAVKKWLELMKINSEKGDEELSKIIKKETPDWKHKPRQRF